MAVNFPFPNNSDVTLYKHNALQIIHKLVNLVKEIHQKGFAIVDFQPENIMIDTVCTYQCCLFSGTAGLAMYSNTVKLNFNKTNSFDIYLQALNNFMLSTNRKNMLVPGQFGVKCSMDYETGAAGVLIALLNIENQINWLPLLANNPLNIFNSKPTTQLKVMK